MEVTCLHWDCLLCCCTTLSPCCWEWGWAEARSVAMETSNYLRHQQFTVNNFLSSSEHASRRWHPVPHFSPRFSPRLSPDTEHFVGVNRTSRRQIIAHCWLLKRGMQAVRVVDTFFTQRHFIFLYLGLNRIGGLLRSVFKNCKKKKKVKTIHFDHFPFFLVAACE